MATTDAAPPAPTIASTRQVRDVRGFWRVLLAVIAPLPMVFMGLFSILSPVDGGESFTGTVTAFAGSKDRLELLEWLGAPFLMLLVPATFAVAWVSRRRTPRLTTVGALLAVGGVSAGFGLLPGAVHPAYLTVRDGLDVATVDKLYTATSEHPLQLIGGLLFILGITVGLLLLGIALWRSRVAPAWMGIALALGGGTHPFMPGHVAAGIGLLVTAVGFAGASVALLRASNDDFDLPPVRIS
jgi:hypothetical protein